MRHHAKLTGGGGRREGGIFRTAWIYGALPLLLWIAFSWSVHIWNGTIYNIRHMLLYTVKSAQHQACKWNAVAYIYIYMVMGLSYTTHLYPLALVGMARSGPPSITFPSALKYIFDHTQSHLPKCQMQSICRPPNCTESSIIVSHSWDCPRPPADQHFYLLIIVKQ